MGSVHAPTAKKISFSTPTAPKVTLNNPFVGAGLRGETASVGKPVATGSWGLPKLPGTSLNKVAEDSGSTKHDLLATGLIGGLGAGTSVLTDTLFSKGLVKRTKPKVALVGGGLGLVADYAGLRAAKLFDVKPKKEGTPMNKVASVLLDKAAQLRQSTPELVAIGMLKQAGLDDSTARAHVMQESMEKAAAESLTYSGIDAEDAVRLVKAANINISELQGASLFTEEEALADVLEKAAEYIESQEAQIQALSDRSTELEKVASEASAPEPYLPETFTKMASVGAFTFDDLEALKAMPSDTLTKMASAFDKPWELGKAAGMSSSTGDPLLDFCLG